MFDNPKIKYAIFALIGFLVLLVIVLMLLPTKKKETQTTVVPNNSITGLPVNITGTRKNTQITTAPQTISITNPASSTTNTPSQTPTRKIIQTLQIGSSNQTVFQSQIPSDAPQKVFSWLDSMKNNTGVYYYGYSCDLQKTNCKYFPTDNRVGAQVIWARFQQYKKTRDANDLASLTNDLATYTDVNRVPTIQNEFWNCKLMSDLIQDTTLSTQIRDSAKQICARGGYYPLDYDQINTIISSGSFKEPNIQDLLQGKGLPSGLTTDIKRFTDHAVYSSDFSTKYMLNRQEKDLQIAKLYFTKALYEYGQNEQELSDKYALLGIASLDLYKATKNQQYLDEAIKIGISQQGKSCSTLTGCMAWIWLSRDLFVYTKNPVNQSVELDTAKIIYKKGFDKTKGVFVNIESVIYVYPTRDNALLIGLLINE